MSKLSYDSKNVLLTVFTNISFQRISIFCVHKVSLLKKLSLESNNNSWQHGPLNNI